MINFFTQIKVSIKFDHFNAGLLDAVFESWYILLIRCCIKYFSIEIVAFILEPEAPFESSERHISEGGW